MTPIPFWRLVPCRPLVPANVLPAVALDLAIGREGQGAVTATNTRRSPRLSSERPIQVPEGEGRLHPFAGGRPVLSDPAQRVLGRFQSQTLPLSPHEPH